MTSPEPAAATPDEILEELRILSEGDALWLPAAVAKQIHRSVLGIPACNRRRRCFWEVDYNELERPKMDAALGTRYTHSHFWASSKYVRPPRNFFLRARPIGNEITYVRPEEPPTPVDIPPLLMSDGHDATECYQCVTYAIWMWPFAQPMSKGHRDAEGAWLKGKSDVYIIGDWKPGTRFAQNIFPAYADVDHVVRTRPEGMKPWEWVEAMGVIDAPTPWDEIPKEVIGGFWHDWADRRWKRDRWIASHPNVHIPTRSDWVRVDDGRVWEPREEEDLTRVSGDGPTEEEELDAALGADV